MENDRQAPGMPVFMDAVVYTVKYNTSNKVTEVINHTDNNVSEEKIIKLRKYIGKFKYKAGKKNWKLLFRSNTHMLSKHQTR